MNLEHSPHLGTFNEFSITPPAIEKAVIISHPDNRTTGGPSTTEGEMLSGFGQKFLEIQTRLLGRYRKRGFTNIALGYGDTFPNHFSHLYPYRLFDFYVTTPTPNSESGDNNLAQELTEVLPTINLSPDAEIIIGGYRAGICVDIVKKTLDELGFAPRINYLLTNQAAFMVMSREARQMLGPLYDQEHFDNDRAIWDSIKKGQTTIQV